MNNPMISDQYLERRMRRIGSNPVSMKKLLHIMFKDNMLNLTGVKNILNILKNNFGT